MDEQSFFQNAIVYLLAAVISVPVAKRLGFGSVLGYLLAGMIIGPFVLGYIGSEGEDVMHFAEFGVVMMLFLVGLELRPSLLWQMRTPILGMGGSQVFMTFISIGLLSMFFLPWQQSAAVGMILALSSTAIDLSTLRERGLMNTSPGQSIFSVLLFAAEKQRLIPGGQQPAGRVRVLGLVHQNVVNAAVQPEKHPLRDAGINQ